ncbi:MAG: hypothetical protein C5B60_10320 [Chloroflexi bacterium]|nr:MAG: hypothetical protein C5B60_10320 [Chloroflexota bacterium]
MDFFVDVFDTVLMQFITLYGIDAAFATQNYPSRFVATVKMSNPLSQAIAVVNCHSYQSIIGTIVDVEVSDAPGLLQVSGWVLVPHHY